MKTNLKIGYFEHWMQPPYKFVDFLREQGVEIRKIDYSNKNYLEEFDVALIEQNGFNDYIENDEPYIQEWVKRGGIMCFMHQDYCRWVPQFMPENEVGYTQLIHRYIPTIYGDRNGDFITGDKTHYMTYMMPWIEEPGRRLFSEPEQINPDDMIGWRIMVGSFSILRGDVDKARLVRTAAESCYLANPKWEILGSYMDPAVREGALILRAKCGKGMFFLNQLLFPEIRTPEAEKCFKFWKKYVPNLLAYFQRFKNGESEVMPPKNKTMPVKKNYKLATHMHSLDWYGCDAQPGTINALMREMKYDICALALKDTTPYKGKMDVSKYSDDHVLFLDGQECHPFNWKDSHEDVTHNCYHMLAIGIDSDAYTPEFTRSLYGDEEVAAYLKKSIDRIHEKHGAVCTAHPYFDYWANYDYDAVDLEPMLPLSGTDLEKYWISGKRKAVMHSVDLFGTRRMYDNPAVNFVYLQGEAPSRDSVVKAIRTGHTIAGTGYDEADVDLNGYIPGDEVPLKDAAEGTLKISAKVAKGRIRKVRVYSGADVIWSIDNGETAGISLEIPLKGKNLKTFVRVELEGENEHWICNSTPFYLV